MNFGALYERIETTTIKAIQSLWASGDAKTQEYLRQIILRDEPILAEPVFQSTFPWKGSGKTIQAFFPVGFTAALNAVEGEYCFPADRPVFSHQETCWNLLGSSSPKSVVVTSGTGSGKTECFLAPIMHDLWLRRQRGDGDGVQALFLYPLNALMGSQKKRVKAWSAKLEPKIPFAVYNGKTRHQQSRTANQQEDYPELMDRPTIRKTPPQMLFTNPTMLEYMLVRKDDQHILEKSKGKLRWIVLDEAHTYTGSAAAELALLIRRVLMAFAVKVEDVRFAITSATIGSGEEAEKGLRTFIADIIGQSVEQIEVVGGTRVVPDWGGKSEWELESANELLKVPADRIKTCRQIQDLRNELNEKPALSFTRIGELVRANSSAETFAAIQRLTEDEKILSVRAHFHVRSLPGIYVCTNPKCTRHDDIAPRSALGKLSTRLDTCCPKCKYPMLELITCKSCGTHYMKGEVQRGRGTEMDRIRIRSLEKADLFGLEKPEEDDHDDDAVTSANGWETIYLGKSENTDLMPCEVMKDGTCDNTTAASLKEIGDKCAVCGEWTRNFRTYMTGASFYNRLLAPILLEQAPPKEKTAGLIWEGRKLISFSDNRQGTAKIAAYLNNDVERNWVRSQLYHTLSDERRKNASKGLSPNDLDLFEKYKQVPALFSKELKEFEEKMDAAKNPDRIPSPSITWGNVQHVFAANTSLRLLKVHVAGQRVGIDDNDYAYALLLDQFGRRPKREVSPETLGLIKIIYPELDRVEAPDIAIRNGITNAEWHSFLKIAVDYFLRENTCINIPEKVQPLIVQPYYSRKIFPPSVTRIDGKHKSWPLFSEGKQIQSRLVLLLCAGLGLHNIEDLDNTKIDVVNSLLRESWQAIRNNLLLNTGSDEHGYTLDLQTKASFELVLESWLCPVTRKPLDTVFKSYSPWIKGRLEPEALRRFKVADTPMRSAFFPYARNLDHNGDQVTPQKIWEWCQEPGNFRDYKVQGLWSDIHEKILNDSPIFLAGEHSAQQSDKRLEELESAFDHGKLNVLNCSTTMEMGVDIGGIAVVQMNNVPPFPANYLQRAGRAGRRLESRSIAVTLCTANPVGENAFNNPAWAMESAMRMPQALLNSSSLVLRHLNSYLLGRFIREQEQGMAILEKVESFFIPLTDAAGTCGYDRFTNWLVMGGANNAKSDLERLIRTTVWEGTSYESILSRCQNEIGTIGRKVRQKADFTNGEIQRLRVEEKYPEDALAIKALKRSLDNLLRENLLSYLVSQGFLPSAGIPTGVIDFDLTNVDDLKKNESKEKREDNLFTRKGGPSREIGKAIHEYAPGRDIVLDGWVYRSAGITLDSAFTNGKLTKIKLCRKCGHQLEEQAENYGEPCPVCGEKTFQNLLNNGERATELVEPSGFAVDLYETPCRKPSAQPFVKQVDPVLLGMDGWQVGAFGLVGFRTSNRLPEIVHYDVGLGSGYHLCTVCGRMEPLDNYEVSSMGRHFRLRGGKEKSNQEVPLCASIDNPAAIRSGVVLAGRFATDVCEFRVGMANGKFSNDSVLLTTLGVALKKELVESLQIDEDEIGFGLRSNRTSEGDFVSVFFYDTVKGGADYSPELKILFDTLLRKAMGRLKKCNCSKACTRCLIDRNSQWYLDSLSRKVLLQWYESVQSCFWEVPPEIRASGLELLPETTAGFAGLIAELQKRGTQTIRLFIDGDMERWDPESFPLFRELKSQALYGKRVELVIKDHKVHPDAMAGWELYKMLTPGFSLLELEFLGNLPVLPIAQCVSASGQTKTWVSSSTHGLLLNDGYAATLKHPVYSTLSDVPLVLKTFAVPDLHSLFPKANVFERYFVPQRIKMSLFGSLLVEQIIGDRAKAIVEGLRGQQCALEYSDRYLNSPLGGMLLSELVKELTQNRGLQLAKATIQLESIENMRGGAIYQNDVGDNWSSSIARKNFLVGMLKESGISSVTVLDKRKNEMAHYRYCKISSSKVELVIRPDGGIEHGWKSAYREGFPFKGKTDEMLQVYNTVRESDLYPCSQHQLVYTTTITDK